MPKQNRFQFKTEEAKQKYLHEIIGFFQDERGEEIGLLAAEQILDFFIDTLGTEMYKKAIGDSKKLLNERLNDLEVELELLVPRE